MARSLLTATLVSILALGTAVPASGQDADMPGPSVSPAPSADSPTPIAMPSLCPSGRPVVPAQGMAQDTTSPASVTLPSPTTDTTSTLERTSSPTARTASLGGSWSKLPRAPFSALDPVALWAGGHMVTIDHGSGRTATYDPPMRRWEEHQPLPHEPDTPSRTFDGVSMAVVAGEEVVARSLSTGPEDHWYEWYAFDPATGRWREVAPSPFERNAGGFGAWTGDLLVMVAQDRSAAAYDPAGDCWLEMPAAPLPEVPQNAASAQAGEWSVRSVHWTGAELTAVIVRDEADGSTGIVSFDPSSWAWTPGSLGPIDGDLVDPVPVDGVLWFMTEDPNDAYGGQHITNATYDPTTDTWTEADTSCAVNTRWATWTGRLIMEPHSDRRAFDPATGACYRTPASKDRARQWEAVWTGREFLYWSGAYGDTSRARPDGIIYRPPRSAFTTEKAEPLGKKLKRAIAARRERGFETDPDLVRAIMRDPYQPGSRQYGFPMTEAEYWDLNDRSWFSHETQKEVIPYVKRRPTRGGWWSDQRHGGRLAIALTEADPEVIARIDALMPTEPDLGWRLVIVERPLKELRTAQWRAPTVSKRLDPTAMLWSSGVDVKDGVVTLMYDPDDVKRMRARKKELEKRLGVPVRITSGRVRDN